MFILEYSSVNREICQGVQRTFQQMDYKQLYIFEVNIVELNPNIFVELPISSLDFYFINDPSLLPHTIGAFSTLPTNLLG